MWFGSFLSALGRASEVPAKPDTGWQVMTGVAGCCTANEGVDDGCDIAAAGDGLGSAGAVEGDGTVVAVTPVRKHRSQIHQHTWGWQGVLAEVVTGPICTRAYCCWQVMDGCCKRNISTKYLCCCQLLDWVAQQCCSHLPASCGNSEACIGLWYRWASIKQ